MNAILLAAGLGTRLKPLTNSKPKALVALGKKPLIEHVFESLEKAGVTETTVVTGKFGNQIEEFFGNRFKKMKLNYVTQPKPLGTANALQSAEEFAGKEFLLGHCDVIPPPKTWKTLSKLRGFDCVMTLRRSEKPEKYGVAVVENGRVAELIEKPNEPPSNLVNAGCYKFNEKIFGLISNLKPSKRGELELTDAIKILLRQKKVGYCLEEGKIHDIGTIEELRDAENEIGEEEIKL